MHLIRVVNDEALVTRVFRAVEALVRKKHQRLTPSQFDEDLCSRGAEGKGNAVVEYSRKPRR